MPRVAGAPARCAGDRCERVREGGQRDAGEAGRRLAWGLGGWGIAGRVGDPDSAVLVVHGSRELLPAVDLFGPDPVGGEERLDGQSGGVAADADGALAAAVLLLGLDQVGAGWGPPCRTGGPGSLGSPASVLSS